MSDNKTSLINIGDLPDSVDNAVKNLTDLPTKNIGQTFSDVWYLIFGNISQAADKRRMKYAHDLKLYSQELSQAIADIPDENLIEPSIQTTAQALENSKYCIESTELRKLFVNLISNSLNCNYAKSIHPAFAEIIKQMSPLDARILKTLEPNRDFPLVDYVLQDRNSATYDIQLSNVYLPPFPDVTIEEVSFSISSLERLGIITIDKLSRLSDRNAYFSYENTDYYKSLLSTTSRYYPHKKVNLRKYLGCLSAFGQNFFEVCVK